MDRRLFLRGALALVAISSPAIVRATSLMPVKAWLPTVWGDGIHDDTDGIMAAFDGQEFVNRAGLKLIGGSVYFPAGPYKIVSTVALPANRQLIGAALFSGFARETRV